MSGENRNLLHARRLRWIARVWSLVIFTLTLIIVFSPDERATHPVPVEDWFLLALWGVAIAGLLVAWRWEVAGATITLLALCLREVAWVLLKGQWRVNFLLVWVLLLPPAILFVLARHRQSQSPASSPL